MILKRNSMNLQESCEVYDSFGSLCGTRVGNAEMPFCRAYGDVIAAALASQMAATVGSGEQICESIFEFTIEMKQASGLF